MSGAAAARIASLTSVFIISIAAMTSEAAEPPARVLPPTVGALVEAAIGRAGPRWSLREATVEAVTVRGTLQLQDASGASAVEFELRDPEPSCSDIAAGAWCLSLATATPAEARQALIQALAQDPATTVWRAIPASARRGIFERARESAGAAGPVRSDDSAGDADAEKRPRWPALLALAALALGTVALAWRWMATEPWPPSAGEGEA